MDGPYPHFTLIFCRSDEFASTKVAAFADFAEASEHARLRLLQMPDCWISVVVAEGVGADLEFIGAWDRDAEGALTWQAASLA